MTHLWRQLAITTNWPIMAAVAVLTSLGTVSIWAVEAADAKKQLLYIAVGLACMFLFQVVNYLHIGRYAWPFYIVSLVLVIYTIIPGVPFVPRVNGARAWIDFGRLRLEPAELLKVAFCMVLARYLRFRSNYRTFTGLLQPFALALVPVLFILMQPDLGMALLFIPALFAMLFVAGAKARHLLAVMGLGMLLIPLAWFSGPGPDAPDLPILRHIQLLQPYQRQRIEALFSGDPRNLKEKGFQQEQALIAMGSGGWAGRGALNVPIGAHIPEANNDMIFAVIAEQFGFIGSAVLLGAYLMLFAAGIEVASATREPFGRLLAIGTVALLAAQSFINLGVCTRLIPVTGITLPFVSYGGSSLLASFMAAGLLLNIGQNRPLVMAKDSFEFE